MTVGEDGLAHTPRPRPVLREVGVVVGIGDVPELQRATVVQELQGLGAIVVKPLDQAEVVLRQAEWSPRYIVGTPAGHVRQRLRPRVVEPIACITGLFGTQNTPPDLPVVPPTHSVFSRMATLAPSDAAVAAAAPPAAPEPAHHDIHDVVPLVAVPRSRPSCPHCSNAGLNRKNLKKLR